MPDAIRAFLAIPVPPATRRAIGEVGRRLARALPGARFVTSDQMHVTLHFFASLTPAQVDATVEATRMGAVGARAFQLGLSGLGVFPDERRPRVLWVAISPGAEEVERLAGAIGSELAARGLPVDERPFRPHLTIARFQDGMQGVPVAPALREGADVAIPAFGVSRLVLFRSVLGPAGATHSAISEIPLAW